MSRYSRYPYQNAHVSHQPPVAAHQQLRNPWMSEAPLRPSESQSTNSSSSSRTYRGGGSAVGPGPPPAWLQHPPPEPLPHHYNHLPPRATHYAVLDQHIEVLDGANHLLPPQVPPPSGLAKHYSTSSRAASDRDRPVTPASSPGGSGGGAVDGCGGHCVAFDNFCYYCLQVIFMAGILIGVSLTIAGFVLRSQQRARDLMVLVYIGCMLAMVCGLLLAVQCCVRRNVKRRKRALRQARDRTRRPPPQQPSSDMIPLQELAAPLLVRLVQQNPSADMQRHGQYIPQPGFRGVPAAEEGAMDTSRSGTPWWRRRGELETRH